MHVHSQTALPHPMISVPIFSTNAIHQEENPSAVECYHDHDSLFANNTNQPPPPSPLLQARKGTKEGRNNKPGASPRPRVQKRTQHPISQDERHRLQGLWATQESNLGFFGSARPQRSVLTTILVTLCISCEAVADLSWKREDWGWMMQEMARIVTPS